MMTDTVEIMSLVDRNDGDEGSESMGALEERARAIISFASKRLEEHRDAGPLLYVCWLMAVRNGTVRAYADLLVTLCDELCSRSQTRALTTHDLVEVVSLLLPLGFDESVSWLCYSGGLQASVARDPLVEMSERRLVEYIKQIRVDEEKSSVSSLSGQAPVSFDRYLETSAMEYESFVFLHDRLVQTPDRASLFSMPPQKAVGSPSDIVQPRIVCNLDLSFDPLSVYRKTTWRDLYFFLMSRYEEHKLVIVDIHLEGVPRASSLPIVFDTTGVELSTYDESLATNATNATLHLHAYFMFSSALGAFSEELERSIFVAMLLEQFDGPRAFYDGIGSISALMPFVRFFETRNGDPLRTIRLPGAWDTFRFVDMFAIAVEVFGINPFPVFRKAGIQIWFPFSYRPEDGLPSVREVVARMAHDLKQVFAVLASSIAESSPVVGTVRSQWQQHFAAGIDGAPLPRALALAVLYMMICKQLHFQDDAAFTDVLLSGLDGRLLFSVQSLYGINGGTDVSFRAEQSAYQVVRACIRSADVREIAIMSHPYFSAFPRFETAFDAAFEHKVRQQAAKSGLFEEMGDCDSCVRAFFLTLGMMHVYRIHQTYKDVSKQDQRAVMVQFTAPDSSNTPFIFRCSVFFPVLETLLRSIQVSSVSENKVFFVNVQEQKEQVEPSQLFYHFALRSSQPKPLVFVIE